MKKVGKAAEHQEKGMNGGMNVVCNNKREKHMCFIGHNTENYSGFVNDLSYEEFCEL